VRARDITDELAGAVARALAQYAEEHGVREDVILPRMGEWELHPRLAVAAAPAREATAVLTRAGLIPRGRARDQHAEIQPMRRPTP
jgi:malic enzyme